MCARQSSTMSTRGRVYADALLRDKKQEYLDKTLQKQTEPDAGKRFVCVGVELITNLKFKKCVRLRMREENTPGMHHAAVEGGVDGGGMASKPGAEELDIFSGDSEEEEKKAVEALTQMLYDDPLAYQETLRPGWSQTDSQRATGETRDSGPRRAYVPITTAAPGTLPLLPANMNPSMAVLAVAPAAAMLADARAPAVCSCTFAEADFKIVGWRRSSRVRI